MVHRERDIDKWREPVYGKSVSVIQGEENPNRKRKEKSMLHHEKLRKPETSYFNWLLTVSDLWKLYSAGKAVAFVANDGLITDVYYERRERK